MALARDLLVDVLRNPARATTLSGPEWNQVLRQARHHQVLARLACALEDLDCLDQVPAKARDQLLGARIFADLNHTAVRFEINRLLRALTDVDVSVVLLKGAAYLMAGLAPARGRVFVDLDILIPEKMLESVEKVLLSKGWEAAELDKYDQHYYRAWMHEIPPLTHPEREMEIDIHHTILPKTGRANPEAAALFAAATPLENNRLRVLAPADMVLHGAVHLFHEDFMTGLRQLLDLHDLLCHFGKHDEFWLQLAERSRLHGLQRTHYYLLRYTQQILGTPVPEEVKTDAERGAPSRGVLFMMDWLIGQALLPETLDEPRRSAKFARWLLYLRSHWLRMPPLLLTYHLSVKALRRMGEWTQVIRAGG